MRSSFLFAFAVVIVGCGDDPSSPAATATATTGSSASGSGGGGGGDAAGCAQLAAGNHDLTLMHDGVERSVVLHVPPGYDPGKPAPLVLTSHGYTSNATSSRCSRR